MNNFKWQSRKDMRKRISEGTANVWFAEMKCLKSATALIR